MLFNDIYNYEQNCMNCMSIYTIKIDYITGQEVVLVKDGTRICGTGGALGNTAVISKNTN